MDLSMSFILMELYVLFDWILMRTIYSSLGAGFGQMENWQKQPNTALEPTAATPAVGSHAQIHACGFPRRGSALDR
jgi:hypothetical protein